MAASVASSAVGLLDRHYSPHPRSPEPNDVTRWPDLMDVDHAQGTEPFDTCAEVALGESSQPAKNNNNLHPEDNGEQNDSDRQHAIGGLLAALATNGSNALPQPNVGQAMSIRRSMTPPVDSPISQTSQNEFAIVKEEGAIQMSNDAQLPNDGSNIEHSTQMPSLHIDTSNSMLSHLGAMPFSEEDLASLPFPSLDMAMHELPPDLQDELPINVKRQIDAYARLEFADGTFYLNTYQCELGRDQHAYRDALQRDREAKEAAEQEKNLQKSSSGRASQRSLQIKAESQVQGSVVSEAGGFAGVDDQPVASSDKRNNADGKNHSSQASESSIVRPADVLHNPSLLPYDYHKDVVYQPAQLALVPENDLIEDEQPAPVTSEHLPDPNSCPLIPIHTTIESDQTEAESLKAISRRHVRISWNSKESAFFMHVLGRNGAFFEDEHMKRGENVRLYTGARIQISAVEFTFRLPDIIANKPEEEDEESSLASEDLSESSPGVATSAANGQPIKLKLKLNTDPAASQSAALNGELKRRGPGRPPKNGIMSQREMKEREKAEKEAKARSGSSVTTPPALQRKFSKSQLPNPEVLPTAEASKVDKRKYTKRKREDGEDDEVLPSIEAQEETPVAEPPPPPPPPQPVAKRARTKSFSPEYKPQDQCTPEDLARPPHNYAVLLYMVLSETGEITLRQIYKQMQSRWPYFKYVVDSDGWTSSVRHNLNQEVGKLFERGRKEGKGFTWLPKPNAMEEYQAQKNKRSNAPPVPKPRPPPHRTNYTGASGQQLTWQNSTAARESQQPGGAYPISGPWQSQPNGTKGGSMPTGLNGQRPMSGQPPNMPVDPNYIPPTHLLPQHFGKPAPRFMPVTFEGLAVIARFEQSMFQNLRQDEATQVKWRQIFASAKGRCLHGNEKSTLEGGETAEEATIVKHISDFVTRYKNPAFEGFKSRGPESPSLLASNMPVIPPNSAQNGVGGTPVPTVAPQANSQSQTQPAQQQPQQPATSHPPVPALTQSPQPPKLPPNINSNGVTPSIASSQTPLTSQAAPINHAAYPPPLPPAAPASPAPAATSGASATQIKTSPPVPNYSRPPSTVPTQVKTPGPAASHAPSPAHVYAAPAGSVPARNPMYGEHRPTSSAITTPAIQSAMSAMLASKAGTPRPQFQHSASPIPDHYARTNISAATSTIPKPESAVTANANTTAVSSANAQKIVSPEITKPSPERTNSVPAEAALSSASKEPPQMSGPNA